MVAGGPKDPRNGRGEDFQKRRGDFANLGGHRYLEKSMKVEIRNIKVSIRV